MRELELIPSKVLSRCDWLTLALLEALVPYSKTHAMRAMEKKMETAIDNTCRTFILMMRSLPCRECTTANPKPVLFKWLVVLVKLYFPSLRVQTKAIAR